MESSASVIISHNHPSGDPTPSKEDIAITEKLIEGGKILGIDVLDHVIIGDGRYVSLKDEGLVG
ncbi:MAG TPA: JAB domain-containing protein, partial [Methanomethylovorans sp.]|nr:JAB domain-containing protein [Methanomethylovorans sp.]